MSIRIKTVSQLYLLKQINKHLGNLRVPDTVIRRMFRILYSRELGKDGFIVLCLKPINDDFPGLEDVVGLYPLKLWIEDDVNGTMDEIQATTHKGRIRTWYVTHARIRGQNNKIKIIHTTKEPCW